MVARILCTDNTVIMGYNKDNRMAKKSISFIDLEEEL